MACYRRCLDCPDEVACNLRRVMVEARDQLAAVLDNRSLADARGGMPNLALTDETRRGVLVEPGKN